MLVACDAHLSQKVAINRRQRQRGFAFQAQPLALGLLRAMGGDASRDHLSDGVPLFAIRTVHAVKRSRDGRACQANKRNLTQTRGAATLARMSDQDPELLHAFPLSAGDEYQRGMTLRDWFAGQALQGMLANPGTRDDITSVELADLAYLYADALLMERDK